MKHIKLAVAQRYLQRYTGAQIECAYKEGETPEADFFPSDFCWVSSDSTENRYHFFAESERFFEAGR